MEMRGTSVRIGLQSRLAALERAVRETRPTLLLYLRHMGTDALVPRQTPLVMRIKHCRMLRQIAVSVWGHILIISLRLVAR
jgi:hypothetical protein